MSQIARPISDLSVTGWTPTPVYPQIGGTVANDSSPVTATVSSGGSFDEQLSPVLTPGPGAVTLTVRLQKTDANFGLVLVTLYQSGSLIAFWPVNPTTSFATYTITLTAAQVSLITNYAALQVTVATVGVPFLLQSTSAFVNGTGSISATWGHATTLGSTLIAVIATVNTGVMLSPPTGWVLAGYLQSVNGMTQAIYYLTNASSETSTGSFSVPSPGLNTVLVVAEFTPLQYVSNSTFNTAAGNSTSPSVTTLAPIAGIPAVEIIGICSLAPITFSSPTNSFAIIAQKAGTSASAAALLYFVPPTVEYVSGGCTISVREPWTSLIASFYGLQYYDA